MTRDDALKHGTAIFIITVVSGISYLHYSYLGYCSGMKVRVAVSSLVYRKVCHCFIFNGLELFVGTTMFHTK